MLVMKRFLRDNSLSLVFLALFAVAIAGQIYFGWQEYNKELLEEGGAKVWLWQYLSSGHFAESTFENWESEFLQMTLFVVLTIFLQQKGSSESKDFDRPQDVDRRPDPLKSDAPWPVRKGGIWLSHYKNSLTIALFLLFATSFVTHFYGSLSDENTRLSLPGKSVETPGDYLGDSRFWFESFQNWQSEFLSVLAIVILSIYLRQHGSPQSKPVDAPHSQTGD